MTFICRQFHKKYLSHQSLKSAWQYYYYNPPPLPSCSPTKFLFIYFFWGGADTGITLCVCPSSVDDVVAEVCFGISNFICMCMRPANERQLYIVTSSPIGWAHTQNDPFVVTCHSFPVRMSVSSEVDSCSACVIVVQYVIYPISSFLGVIGLSSQPILYSKYLHYESCVQFLCTGLLATHYLWYKVLDIDLSSDIKKSHHIPGSY